MRILATTAAAAQAEGTVPDLVLPPPAPPVEPEVNPADLLEGFDWKNWRDWLDKLTDFAVEFGPKLAAAVVTVFVGWIIARIVANVFRKLLRASRIDETLTAFTGHVVYGAIMAFAVVAGLGRLGVETTSFVAIIGAATFAVGFALQGSLSNFAAGVMMMIFRPLRVGDLVDAGGVHGIVEEIGIFATVINTLDNKRVIVSNASITDQNIVNYSANGKIRIDMVFGIGYGDDVDRARETLLSILQADQRVLADPAPAVELLELGDSSVNLACRPFVDPQHYWDVWFDTHRAVKKTFDAEGISIPFPQRDVHLFQAS